MDIEVLVRLTAGACSTLYLHGEAAGEGVVGLELPVQRARALRHALQRRHVVVVLRLGPLLLLCLRSHSMRRLEISYSTHAGQYWRNGTLSIYRDTSDKIL